MKRTRTRKARFPFSSRSLPFPWGSWFDLAAKTGEMLGASAYVIGHRTDRLARAGSKPSASDRREFTRMVQEKFQAATESAFAAAPHLWRLQVQAAELATRNMLAGVHAMYGIGERGMLPAGTARAKRVAKDSKKLAAAAVRVAHAGLKPVHARAVANRNRLGSASVSKPRRGR